MTRARRGRVRPTAARSGPGDTLETTRAQAGGRDDDDRSFAYRGEHLRGIGGALDRQRQHLAVRDDGAVLFRKDGVRWIVTTAFASVLAIPRVILDQEV